MVFLSFFFFNFYFIFKVYNIVLVLPNIELIVWSNPFSKTILIIAWLFLIVYLYYL